MNKNFFPKPLARARFIDYDCIMINSTELQFAHFLHNAINFIIDSINDDHSIDDILNLDDQSLFEFAQMNQTTPRAIYRAIECIREMMQ